MLRGTVAVLAYDQDATQQLAHGELMLIDNQIDQTTSTIRLKARFPNEDARLWPGEFVRVRAQVEARENVVTIPPPALQRGPNGLFAWVIRPDGTAEPARARRRDRRRRHRDRQQGTRGWRKVVINGQYRLQAGTRVDAKPEGAQQATASAS